MKRKSIYYYPRWWEVRKNIKKIRRLAAQGRLSTDRVYQRRLVVPGIVLAVAMVALIICWYLKVPFTQVPAVQAAMIVLFAINVADGVAAGIISNFY